MTQEPFTVSFERHAPTVLYLRGSLTRSTAIRLYTAVSDAIATSTSGVTLDLTDVPEINGMLLDAIDVAAASAAATAHRLTLRLPQEDLERVRSSTRARVAVEETAPVHIAGSASLRPEERAPRAAVRPGVPRREGAGFVPSYGQGRPCAVRGCPTTLSRYNPKDVCSAHVADRSESQ